MDQHLVARMVDGTLREVDAMETNIAGIYLTAVPCDCGRPTGLLVHGRSGTGILSTHNDWAFHDPVLGQILGRVDWTRSGQDLRDDPAVASTMIAAVTYIGDAQLPVSAPHIDPGDLGCV